MWCQDKILELYCIPSVPLKFGSKIIRMVYIKGLKSQGYINLITFVLLTLNLYNYNK